MSVWVLGAGPVSAFPSEVPRLVIAASEGVSHRLRNPLKFPRFWAIVPAEAFVEDPDYTLSNTEASSKVLAKLQTILSENSPYEQLLIRPNLDFRGRDAVMSRLAQSIATNISTLGYHQIARMWLSHFSISEIVELNLEQNKNADIFRKMMSFTSWRRVFSGHLLKASTGALAFLVALGEANPGEVVHVLGITADRKTYAHDYYAVPKHGMHFESDVILFRRVIKTRKSIEIKFGDHHLDNLVRS